MTPYPAVDGDGSRELFAPLPGTAILPISASQVGIIIDMNHQCQAETSVLQINTNISETVTPFRNY
jgi:hypothetical protein